MIRAFSCHEEKAGSKFLIIILMTKMVLMTRDKADHDDDNEDCLGDEEDDEEEKDGGGVLMMAMIVNMCVFIVVTIVYWHPNTMIFTVSLVAAVPNPWSLSVTCAAATYCYGCCRFTILVKRSKISATTMTKKTTKAKGQRRWRPLLLSLLLLLLQTSTYIV